MDVVGIECFGVSTFEDAALAALVATMQALPGFADVGLPFFCGGVVYLGRLHGFFKKNKKI